MSEVNLAEAFGSYKAKPAPRGRSVVTADGTLVMSCWYTRFGRAQADVLRYEEDLSAETGTAADTLRAHLAQAMEHEYEVRLVVAVEPTASTAPVIPGAKTIPRPQRTTFHARKDLVGKVTFYDGQRFIIEFRKRPLEVKQGASA
jgi:hypothetical protein